MTRNLLITAGLLFGALSTPVHADTLTTFTNVGQGNSNLITVSGDGGDSGADLYVGRYSGQLGSQDINDFCIDLNHGIDFGQSFTADADHNITDASGPQSGSYYNGGLSSALDSGYYQPVASPVTNQQRADEVAYLIHTYGNATSASAFHDGANLSTNLTAVGLSIWDIETDGGDGLSSGSFVTYPAATSTYGSLVNSLESAASAHDNDQYLDVKWIQAPVGSGGFQSFGYCVAPVPEASTVMIFGMMMAGGLIYLRKKRQTG